MKIDTSICLTNILLFGLCAVPATSARCDETAAKTAATVTREQSDFFERHIRPVLVEQCNECHSATSDPVQGGLRVDSADALRKGGDSGPAIVPGKPEESLLVEALRYESYEMPPSGKLSDEVIDDFARWIQAGAADPRSSDAPAVGAEASRDSPETHWAFQQPIQAEPPAVHNEAWPRTAVDRFVLARLERSGIAPSPPADARTVLRRLYYDLIGLPPTAAEFAAFESRDDDAAYLAAVDRLLASEHFGERWGRYWLDVARYADTKGYVFREDRNYPQAFTYRDWVITAFNEDMPYDQFLLAQLAADQLDDPSAAPAMGFLTLGRRFINNKHDIIDDRIDVVTRGLLGLTGACARCHDHKYDPITMDDYYAMYGVFASCNEPHDEAAPLLMTDLDTPVEPVIFIRGNPASRGHRVPRKFFEFLSEPDSPPYQHGSGRYEMAQAIADADNPLTARVWVNRVWRHLFGQGIVTTPSDFGTRSDPPSHPQLLDWLACRFVQEGWSTKWLIRQIVTSSVYRQSSDSRAEGIAADSENRLLWRMNRRRLDFEAWRDSLLTAAGRLDLSRGGPSVKLTEQPFPTRRTVYAFIERQNLPGVFRTFDFAGPDTHSPGRPYTTVPQQALFAMNSPFAMEQATALASRIDHLPDDGSAARTTALFRFALGRDPSEEELSLASEFIDAEEPVAGEVGTFSDDPWRYGWGHYDALTKRVKFHPLPHFTGTAWQGGGELPDSKLGWVTLSATGGHPGNDQDHAAIRRWLAPREGTLSISGTLKHASDQGDGVCGRVISDRQGVLGEWNVHHGEAKTVVAPFAVAAGETIDVLIDCRSGPSFDGYGWTVDLRLASQKDDSRQTWNSSTGFRGPRPEPLGRWECLAQVLLMTNEFIFID